MPQACSRNHRTAKTFVALARRLAAPLTRGHNGRFIREGESASERFFRFGRHCRFRNYVTNNQIIDGTNELLEKGFLWHLQSPDGRPRYAMHFGRMRSGDDNEAA